MACGGLVCTVLLARWLGIELDSALLTGLGAFFGAMACIRPAPVEGDVWPSPSLAARLGMGAVCLVLIFTAAGRTSGIGVAIGHCRAEYTSARTGPDTLTIDSVLPPGSPRPIGKYGRWMTCGRYRAQQFRP